jgi:hypothetical protein
MALRRVNGTAPAHFMRNSVFLNSAVLNFEFAVSSRKP